MNMGWCILQLLVLLISSVTVSAATPAASSTTKYFNFTIQYASITRLCYTKPNVITVNGQFPGPAIYVREGDNVVVNVTNLVNYNTTIHWHGIHQVLSAWADGPAYITQCPMQMGQSYVYRFKVVGQRGTFFWHAHYSWLRATVYGAFIVLPAAAAQNGLLYPFPPMKQPYAELPPVLLGEWWYENVENVIDRALITGGAYNISNALTINGQPGFLYNCSGPGTTIYNVERGNTYMLRVINAAMNFQLYFAITGHSLTIVETDGSYTLPLTKDIILIAPGQTTNVLITTNQSPHDTCCRDYYMAASVYSPPNVSQVPYPTIPTTAILRYNDDNNNYKSNENYKSTKKPTSSCVPSSGLPTFPPANDTTFQLAFTQSLKGYNVSDVPKQVDISVLHTVGYALQPCPANINSSFATAYCQGPNATILRAGVSNITFATPYTFNILQAYYNHINNISSKCNGPPRFTLDFPDVPYIQYNYTAIDPIDKSAIPATKVRVLPFNATVQIIYQDTATLFFESHPMHLHGHSFYVVGVGNGTFNPNTDPATFNLVNPHLRNTIGVPPGGWAAVRFRANNPGTWMVHCHFDIHQSWGMNMVFITKNGRGPSQTLPPPPPDFPRC